MTVPCESMNRKKCRRVSDCHARSLRGCKSILLFFCILRAERGCCGVIVVGKGNVASRAFVYTNAILLCKMLVGLCPNPICSASCRCRLRVCSKHFYNKKDSLGLFHEGRILGYLHLSGFRFFCAALFLCKEQFYISLCTKKLLHFFFRFSIVRVACFLFCQQVGIFRV